ncbi:MAG: hypothetical protein ACREF3_01225, partial [Acetobacteraceae bacterium]
MAFPNPLVINTGTTVTVAPDKVFQGETIDVGATAGVAALLFQPDPSASITQPNLDAASTISSAVPGVATAEQSLLQTEGTFVNQGTIAADAPGGGDFTTDVQSALPGAAGYFVNDGVMTVASGNTLTLSLDNNAAFLNPGLILVRGGSLDLASAGTNAIDGGFVLAGGLIAVAMGGTVENAIATPVDATGSAPVYDFLDGDNDTLELSQPAQFAGSIVGFGAGDTIDVGPVPITSIIYDNRGVLELLNGGTIVDSLVFASGVFTPGSFAVSGGTAGSFAISTGSDGDTEISTEVANNVWSAGAGTWTVAGNWSGGEPGAFSSVEIEQTGSTPYLIATGTSAIAISSLVESDPNATLQITDSFTVTPAPLQLIAGTLHLGGTGTLVTEELSEVG